MAHLCFFGALVFSPILCTYTTFSLRQTGLYFFCSYLEMLDDAIYRGKASFTNLPAYAQEERKNLWTVQSSNPASLFRRLPLSYSISGIGTAETSIWVRNSLDLLEPTFSLGQLPTAPQLLRARGRLDSPDSRPCLILSLKLNLLL